MEKQLVETWQINHRVNTMLINAITDTGMGKTLSTRGGRSIWQQWIHIHQVRLQWIEICAADLHKKLTGIDKNNAMNRELLTRMLDESAASLSEVLLRGFRDGGRIKGFKNGVLPFLAYFLSHEAHHRGNILLTLKQSGEKIPDSVKWALWEWNK